MSLEERSDDKFLLTLEATSSTIAPVIVDEQKSVSPTITKAAKPEASIHALALSVLAYFCAKAHLEQHDVINPTSIAMVQRCAMDMLGTVEQRKKRLHKVVDSACADHRGEGYPTIGFVFGQLKYFRLRLSKLDAPPKRAKEPDVERRPRASLPVDNEPTAIDTDGTIRTWLDQVERGDVDRDIARMGIEVQMRKGGISPETLQRAARVLGG